MSVFKKGETIRCVDVANITSLTKGKTYTVLDDGLQYVKVLNDDNLRIGYYSHRFLLVEEEVYRSPMLCAPTTTEDYYPRFSAGQRVQALTKINGSEVKEGCIYKVYCTRGNREISLEELRHLHPVRWLKSSWFRHVNVTAEPKVEPGDAALDLISDIANELAVLQVQHDKLIRKYSKALKQLGVMNAKHNY